MSEFSFYEDIPFSSLIAEVIDNRGKTCPTTESGIPLIATNCVRNDLLYPSYDKIRYVSYSLLVLRIPSRRGNPPWLPSSLANLS